MSLFARFRAWFVSSVVAPDLLRSPVSEVDVALDEDDLFEAPRCSGTRLKIGGLVTRSFMPDESLLGAARDEEPEEEITRRVDRRELEERLAAAGQRRR